MHKITLALACLCLAVVSSAADRKPTAPSQGSPYLFVWGGDEARKANDFLAVIDANPSSKNYGRIVATADTGFQASMPHHTEYEFPVDGRLFANDWAAGHTFVFDLTDPLKPRVATQFTSQAGYSFPHSFVRLPNGNVLTTFQSHGTAFAPGGGLLELDSGGKVLRSGSAADRSVDESEIWPYSLTLAPKFGVVVSNNSPMPMPAWAKLPAGSWPENKVDKTTTTSVQVWRLSDLKLVKTVRFPADAGKHNVWPAEPRVLPDGSVYVATFTCGLFRMKGLGTANPTAEQVYTFPGFAGTMQTMCFVPVVVGHYWVQTSAALPGLIVLDVSNPAKPVEVSRLKIDGKRFPVVHWISADRNGDRLVMTGAQQSWLLVARIDKKTGKVSLDDSFRTPGSPYPGIQFEGAVLPKGLGQRTLMHGALFGK